MSAIFDPLDQFTIVVYEFFPLTAWNFVFTVLCVNSLIFVITNFSVWLVWDFYPKTFDGLVLCYSAGLPFFRNTLLSTLLFGLLFKFSFERTSNFIVSKINS